MAHSNDSERRDSPVQDALLEKLRQELQAVPGLALTPEQASRLFDVPREVCGRVLASLAKQGAIYVRPDGRFVGLPHPE